MGGHTIIFWSPLGAGSFSINLILGVQFHRDMLPRKILKHNTLNISLVYDLWGQYSQQPSDILINLNVCSVKKACGKK